MTEITVYTVKTHVIEKLKFNLILKNDEVALGHIDQAITETLVYLIDTGLLTIHPSEETLIPLEDVVFESHEVKE